MATFTAVQALALGLVVAWGQVLAARVEVREALQSPQSMEDVQGTGMASQASVDPSGEELTVVSALAGLAKDTLLVTTMVTAQEALSCLQLVAAAQVNQALEDPLGAVLMVVLELDGVEKITPLVTTMATARGV